MRIGSQHGQIFAVYGMWLGDVLIERRLRRLANKSVISMLVSECKFSKLYGGLGFWYSEEGDDMLDDAGMNRRKNTKKARLC
jgi:hypothetical protein